MAGIRDRSVTVLTRGLGLTAFLAMVVLYAGAASAQTAEVDADFSAYCREAFPGSAYQMRAQSWGTEHYCNQGGTLQGIDLARACEATTGAPTFRTLGTRVLCAPGSGPAARSARTLTTEDFVRYCAEKFPNSVHEVRAEPTGGVHYCRRPGASGGFTLQGIDLADACRSAGAGGDFDKVAGKVVCKAQAGPSRAAAGSGGGSVQPVPDQAPGPEAPETSAPADQASRDDEGGSGKSAGAGAPGALDGVWELTANSIRQGMKVRLAMSGGKVTGTILEVPAHLARAVHNMDGLVPGDPFLYGRLAGDTLTGTTRIGLAAASQIMTRPDNIRCRDFVADIERTPAKWMPFSLRVDGDRLTGRHRFAGLTVGAQGCATYAVPDTPPRLKGGYALFEMVRVTGK